MLERRGVFAALLAALLVGLLVASFDYGITIDEYSRQRNGEMVFEFYRSGLETVTYARGQGGDSTAGSFDTLAVTMQHLLPFDTFETRHLVNAFFGWLGVLLYRAAGPTAVREHGGSRGRPVPRPVAQVPRPHDEQPEGYPLR
ncbi:MAG: hypothetical protein M5U09_08750 [Gammaproteobacteria bacterium]|nr:hypothetical protein [Gammaproteobacteria bacterium]